MKAAEVIAQHCSDGRIKPLYVSFEDEEGMMQQFKVSGFCVIEKPKSLFCNNWIFEIAILVRGQKVLMRLFFHASENRWMIERII